MRGRNRGFALNEHCITKIIRQVMPVKVKYTIVNLKLSHYTTVHLHKWFCLWNHTSHLVLREYGYIFLKVLLQHTETKGTSKIPQTCVGLISWALQQSAQIYFSSFDAPLCKVSQRRSNGFVGTHIYKNRDSLAFTSNVLTAQVVSENGRWQWQRFIAALPSEPVRCYH